MNCQIPILSLLGVVILVACNRTALADDEMNLQREFSAEIVPLLERKCGACHWGTEANAGIDFDSYKTLDRVLNAHRRWSTVIKELESGSMPPEDAKSLLPEERGKLLSWIKSTFALVDCSQVNPGHVTVRRLNRIEYRNTIRDLLGVDFEPAESFPGDDVGHGFDNIGDVLSLPPILMEKYLDAAEAISHQAILHPVELDLKINLAGSVFTSEHQNTMPFHGRLKMLTIDTARKSIQFPAPGTYAVYVVAYGQQAGREPVKMTVLLDGRAMKTVKVRSTVRKPSTHRFETKLSSAGRHELQIRFENDYYKPHAVGGGDRNLFVDAVYVKGPVPRVSEREYLNFGESTDTADAEKFIVQFLPRAFRRPVTDQETAKLLNLFKSEREQGGSFIESIRVLTQAILVSPQFLFKLEQPADKGQIRSLNDYERATAISYFLWSTMPDDELRELATAESLTDPKTWKQQVHRLLKNQRSDALVDNFASQWLNLRLLSETQPDPERFPTVNPRLLKDMAEETRMVIKDIFRRDASVLELLESDFTIINRRLAKHYGIDKSVRKFERVSLSDTARSGILTHASILTLTSNPNRTSPVKRGKWIMENILGDEPPPPLEDIKPLDEQIELTGNLRERMQQHRDDPSCASCHATMDSLGFSLENFDAVGRFRLKDNGFEIDANSELPDGTKLEGAAGLQHHLRTTYKEKFIRCFTEKLLTFALGRGLKYYDRCTVDEIIKRAAKDDYHLSAFVLAIAESDAFLKRSNFEKTGGFEK